MNDNKNVISNQAVRLKKIRLYLGRTRKQLGDAIRISQYTIRSWENGAKKFNAEGVLRVVNGLKENINFSCPFEWLMHGVGASPISFYEEMNTQNNEIEFDPLHERLLKEVITFKRLNKLAHVTIVSDDTFSPIAEIGDYLGLLPVDKSKLENHFGKIVFLELRDESCKFGVLIKKNKNFGVYHLLSKKYYILYKTHINKVFQLIWFRKAC